MTVIATNPTAVYVPQTPAIAAVSTQDETGTTGSGKDTETSAVSASSASLNTAISNPRVSSAVQKALLQYQTNGSVFGREDRNLMAVRGVSDETQLRFAQIVQDAAINGAYDDPIAYIRSLPSDDIEVLRQVHSLAETNGVTSVKTEEGAMNLLLPNEHQVDINNDGLVTTGIANGIRVPPPNAPQAVKDAWKEMTAGMSISDRLKAEAPFLLAHLSANVRTDGNGQIIGFNEPGSADYKNPFGTTIGEWNTLLNDLIRQYTGDGNPDAAAQKHLDMLSTFRDLIQQKLADAALPEEQLS